MNEKRQFQICSNKHETPLVFGNLVMKIKFSLRT